MRIDNQLSIKSQKTLHYYLKDIVIENKRFSNSEKSALDKQDYQGMLNSYKKIISFRLGENSPSIDVLVRIAKGTDLKKGSFLINKNYHTSSKYDFITASIKISDIEELAQEESVLYIEPSFIIQSQLLNSINDINAPDVWSGYCNLVDKIDGTGVIVGILDTKINRDHIAFQDADGQTRILNYDEIGGNPKAHGTHVASIAVGSGDVAGNWRGVAYNSNIYWKSTGNTNDILNNFQWMIDQSGSTPLVVNLSAGYKLGPHDGTTEFETLLDSKIIGNKFFINSCGNYKSNEYYMHYQDELPSSGTLSFSVNLDPDPLPLHTGEDYSNNEFKMEIWYDGDCSIDVKIREPDGDWSEWVDFGNSLNYDFPGDGKVHIFNDGTCYDAGQNYGNGDNVIFFDFFDPWPGDNIIKTGDYIIQLRDHDNNNSRSCKIDAYNTLECIDYDEENIDAITFVGGDFYQTISSPSYASKVISVAACQKESYGGDISSYSSVGPARNDVASISKPDITAPGGDTPPDLAMIIAANYQSTDLFNTGMAGTSQAAPHVSGAIALLLQNFPDLTALEVKNILQVSSGALPNGHTYENGTITNEELKFWGSGKLNILNAYKYMVGYISQSEYDQVFHDAFNNHPYLTGLPVEKVNTNWFLHKKQRLTNGAIFLRTNTSTAFWLGEEIWNAWESLAHIYSGLGLPTSSEYMDAANNNFKTVDFQFGHIYWNGSNTILVSDYTEVGGTINQNTTWSGLIRVSMDVTVNNGKTLTINPGTHIIINGGKKILINGQLIASGTNNDSILFTIYDTTGFSNSFSHNGWAGIKFIDTPSSNDSSIISYCIIEYGLSSTGGGIFLKNFSKFRISNSRIWKNRAMQDGGGIFCYQASPIISNNIISYNVCFSHIDEDPFMWGPDGWVGGGGGGIVISPTSSPLIINNIITNNKVGDQGGGIDCNGSAIIYNNLICNNTSWQGGGGISFASSNSVLYNNTISNNFCYFTGGGINLNSNSNIIVQNCILWGNNTLDGSDDSKQIGIVPINNSINVSYSNIQGGYVGFKNNSENPEFINPTLEPSTNYNALTANWRLQEHSSCIDRGTFENAPQKDLDGKYRNGTCDIGAYEFNGLSANEGFWLGNSNNAWENSGNWYGNTIPNSATNVVVTAGGIQPVISSNANCNNLNIHPQANLTVKEGNSLHVFGNLEINSDKGGTGTIIDNNITIDGIKTIERYIPKYVGAAGWHSLSSPLAAQPIKPEFVVNENPIPGANDFYKWDETINTWINTKAENGNWNTNFENNFVLGNGYLVAYENDVTKSFTQGDLNTGDMNTGDELPALTYTEGKGEGWNLLGNPYPSSIDWDLCQRTASLNGSVYVYDGDAGQYVSWNGTTGSLSDGIIPVMQGFFVKVNSAGQTFTIPNSSRIHSSINFYKNKIVIENLLVLQVTGNRFSDKIYINFNNDATNGFDNQYDAYKLYGINEAPQLFSILPDMKLSINVLPNPKDDIIIPLGLKVGVDTECTIKAIESNFSDTLDIVLEDLKENYSINLNNTDYTFYCAATDNPNRFNLHFNVSTSIQEISHIDPFIVYSQDKKIHIISNSSSYRNFQFQVFNIIGQQVITNPYINSNHLILDVGDNQGIFIVRIIHNNQSVTKKILIK